jgi:hypothetical protein
VFCRYDGVWQEDVCKCGTYSEIHASGPGTKGVLPNLELKTPTEVLKSATAAAVEQL